MQLKNYVRTKLLSSILDSQGTKQFLILIDHINIKLILN